MPNEPGNISLYHNLPHYEVKGLHYLQLITSITLTKQSNATGLLSTKPSGQNVPSSYHSLLIGFSCNTGRKKYTKLHDIFPTTYKKWAQPKHVFITTSAVVFLPGLFNSTVTIRPGTINLSEHHICKEFLRKACNMPEGLLCSERKSLEIKTNCQNFFRV
jgi:hypothetical protein